MPEIHEGSPEVIHISPGDTKANVRAKVGNHLDKLNIALDQRAPKGRTLNFKGSAEAGAKVAELDIFKKAKLVRIDPDKALQEIRFRTLEAEKTLLVPTPGLLNSVISQITPPSECPSDLLKTCATRQGIEQYSKQVDIDENISVDVYIVGSIAVSSKGTRVGNVGGLSDLEYAMLVSLGIVNSQVPVITMVHDCQVLDLPDDMFDAKDLPVDYVVTPTRVIECSGSTSKPSGILWDLLDDDKLNHIPVLKRIRYRQWKAGNDVRLAGQTENPTELSDLILDEEADARQNQRGGGYPLAGRNFPRRRYEDERDNGDFRRGRGDGRRGGWSNRGRYRNYRNSVMDGRNAEAQRGNSFDRGRRNVSNERPTSRPYGRRRQNQGSDVLDAVEGSIYVGSLPRSLRVSQFKTEVRGRKVNPLRVLWRGSSGFAFLNFKTQQDAEQALVALEGLQISDRPIKFEMAKSPGGQRRQAVSKNGMGENHLVGAQ